MTDLSQTIDGKYSGRANALFGLAFKTGLLTVLTLGIYRFWAKTRIRKYVWSSASGDGDSFEYTGTGLEKFLGFLVAIVVLAIYLGIVQMVLFYFGLNLMAEPRTQAEMLQQVAAIYITLFAVLPLIFFAQYRARRYKLARTRWRGIRFGAEKGGWGYAWRAILHMLLTGVTLGLLLPRQTFHLEKYMTDRSWYGNAQFHQGGKWTALYKAMTHLVIGLLILIAGVAAGVAIESEALALIAGGVGYIWLMIGMVSYNVQAFRYLTSQKELDGGITFAAAPRTGAIIVRVIVGGLLVALVTGGALMLLGVVAAGAIEPGAPNYGLLAILAVVYVLVLAVAGALSLAWITQPIIKHYVETFSVSDPGALGAIRQRAADTGADAEGFADALDIGGAI